MFFFGVGLLVSLGMGDVDTGFCCYKEGRNLVSLGNRLSWKNIVLGVRVASLRSVVLSRVVLGILFFYLNFR